MGKAAQAEAAQPKHAEGEPEGHLKALSATSVANRDGKTHTFLVPGQTVPKAEIAEHVLDRVGVDPYLEKVLAEATDDDVEAWTAGVRPEPPKDFDRARRFEGVSLPAPDGGEAETQGPGESLADRTE